MNTEFVSYYLCTNQEKFGEISKLMVCMNAHIFKTLTQNIQISPKFVLVIGCDVYLFERLLLKP